MFGRIAPGTEQSNTKTRNLIPGASGIARTRNDAGISRWIARTAPGWVRGHDQNACLNSHFDRLAQGAAILSEAQAHAQDVHAVCLLHRGKPTQCSSDTQGAGYSAIVEDLRVGDNHPRAGSTYGAGDGSSMTQSVTMGRNSHAIELEGKGTLQLVLRPTAIYYTDTNHL